MSRWTLLVFLALTGCNFSAGSPSSVDNTCDQETDCIEGVCEEGICVQSSVAPFAVTVEVDRAPDDPESTAPTSWTFEEQMIDGSTTLDLPLPRTVIVTGTVRWEDAQGPGEDATVPARLTFNRLESESELVSPLPVQTTTLVDLARGGDGTVEADYTTRLVDGAFYELIVEPTSDMLIDGPAFSKLPPRRAPRVEIVADEQGRARVSIDYSDDLTTPCPEVQSVGCTLAGRVLFSNGEEGGNPLTGLLVRAIEESSGRVVSSTSTTDAEGSFSVLISAAAGTYGLRLSSTTAGSLFPDVTLSPSDLAAFTPPIALEFGEPDPVDFSAIVLGSDEKPVPNASVQLSTETALGSEVVGELSVNTTTNGQGRFTATLLPGLYRILITPSQDERRPLGVLLDEVSALSDAEDTVFTLPEPVPFTGSVVAVDGSPISGVPVQARARTAPGSNIPVNRSRDTVTDKDGLFETMLDQGWFDLALRPTDDSGFAWLLEPNVLFEAGGEERQWELGPPVSIAGTVVDGDGAAAAGVTVRLYIGVSGPSGSRPVLAAQAVTDEAGGYRLLVTRR